MTKIVFHSCICMFTATATRQMNHIHSNDGGQTGRLRLYLRPSSCRGNYDSLKQSRAVVGCFPTLDSYLHVVCAYQNGNPTLQPRRMHFQFVIFVTISCFCFRDLHASYTYFLSWIQHHVTIWLKLRLVILSRVSVTLFYSLPPVSLHLVKWENTLRT